MALEGQTTNLNSKPWTQDQLAAFARITGELRSLMNELYPFIYKTFLINQITFTSSSLFPLHYPTLSKDACAQLRSCYLTVDAEFTEDRSSIARARARADLIGGALLSFVLPVLFGAIGALAYVIRAISDQIRTTTFSSSSPTRHFMRVMLGALMGMVIGLFNQLSLQITLPPLAFAFLAGYGVEAFFSLFDDIIGRIRQPVSGAADHRAPPRPMREERATRRRPPDRPRPSEAQAIRSVPIPKERNVV